LTPVPAAPPVGLRHRVRRGYRVMGRLLCVYGILAYGLLPAFWRYHYRHPALQDVPKTTKTANRIPGDPVNVALVGSREEVVNALVAAEWLPADPTTLHSSLGICRSVFLRRPYPQAPMSNLYLFDRHQDLAFQQAVGRSAARRHHVRFWLAPKPDEEEGRPLWVGAGTFDRRVGLAGNTGQVTHHIDADVDAERDKLLDDLEAAGRLAERYRVPGCGPTTCGRNGGRDRYFTDGDIVVGVLRPGGEATGSP
jgi:hypothetical protein